MVRIVLELPLVVVVLVVVLVTYRNIDSDRQVNIFGYMMEGNPEEGVPYFRS